MEDAIPSLQQICYDVLAQYAGYIEDLNGINNQGIREITKKANIFGLANIEFLLSDHTVVDINSHWETIFQAKASENPKFVSELTQYIHGEDFYRQSVLVSTIRTQLSIEEMDDEDLLKLLSYCEGLKILEITKITRLSLSQIFSPFRSLLHCSLKGSKLGPGAASHIRDLISSSHCLQTLNLDNFILKDEGVLFLADTFAASRLIRLDLSWNDLTFDSVRVLCEIARIHASLAFLNLSRNLGPREIKKGQVLVNDIKQHCRIRITVV